MAEKIDLDGSGLFARSQPLAVGDPYKDPAAQGTHGVSKGQRQFLTTPGKKGQTANAIGYGPLEFKRNSDPHQDWWKGNEADRKKNRAKWGTQNGFVYSSPMKRSSSPGDTNATFRGVIEHLGEGTYPEKGRREKVENDVIAKRNVQTNPAKLGGFGVPGTLIGGNIEYMESPYDAQMQSVKQEKKMHRERVGERKPFVSTAKRIECFDSNDHCAASKIYSNEGVSLRPPDKLDTMTPKERAEALATEHKALTRSVVPGALNAFTEHMPDPLDPKVIQNAQKPDRLKGGAGVFRQTSLPKTTATPSIFVKNHQWSLHR